MVNSFLTLTASNQELVENRILESVENKQVMRPAFWKMDGMTSLFHDREKMAKEKSLV